MSFWDTDPALVTGPEGVVGPDEALAAYRFALSDLAGRDEQRGNDAPGARGGGSYVAILDVRETQELVVALRQRDTVESRVLLDYFTAVLESIGKRQGRSLLP